MSHRVSFNRTPRIVQEDSNGLYIIIKKYVYRPTTNGWTGRDERFPNGNLILGSQWSVGEDLRVRKESFEEINEVEEGSWLVEENFNKTRRVHPNYGCMGGAYICVMGVSYENGVRDSQGCTTEEAWILHGKEVKGNEQPFLTSKYHVIDIVQVQKDANIFERKWMVLPNGPLSKDYVAMLDQMCEEQGLPYK